MAGVNRVILVGNLGSDPEVKSIPSGASVCNFALATNESWKDKDGEKQERTEWHRCVCWGKRGEAIGRYAGKGSQLYVEGKNRTRKWEDKDGNTRYTTEVVVTDFQFLDKKGGGGGDPQWSERFQKQPDEPVGPDEDIPFIAAMDEPEHVPGRGACR